MSKFEKLIGCHISFSKYVFSGERLEISTEEYHQWYVQFAKEYVFGLQSSE